MIDLDELLKLGNPAKFQIPKLEIRARLGHALARLPRPRIRKPSDTLIEDATLIAGLAAIAAGCGWIFPPTAPIVGGLFLVVLSLRAARAATSTPAEPQLRDEPVVIHSYSADEEDD